MAYIALNTWLVTFDDTVTMITLRTVYTWHTSAREKTLHAPCRERATARMVCKSNLITQHAFN